MQQNLSERTTNFALSIVKLYTRLPKREEALVLGKQLLRSGTSVGAHYREAMQARSRAEYISKIEVGLQELEESRYWLELLFKAEIIHTEGPLIQEISELIAILVTILKKTKQNKVLQNSDS